MGGIKRNNTCHGYESPQLGKWGPFFAYNCCETNPRSSLELHLKVISKDALYRTRLVQFVWVDLYNVFINIYLDNLR